MSSVFAYELRRVRLATQLAVARSGSVEMQSVAVESARAELANVDAALVPLRADPRQPAARLAASLALTPDEVAFVWAVVARGADPLLLG